MIQLKNVILRRSAKVLLDQATVTVNPGEKVGLIGRNGAGKSTLFALLNGTLHEDGGDFSMPRHWRLAQVEQHMPETADSATAFVLGGDTRLAELEVALAAAEAGDDGMAIAHAHSDLADAGAHDATSRAQALILGLGFQPHELEQPVNTFSGGWRMRLQLARALMCPSDLLLLDEPTNHLDLDALVWLEAWLQRYAGTLVVISHDREFLDAVTGVTLHIEHAKVNRYGGNYSAFEVQRAQQLALQQQAFAKQQDRIAHLQKFIDRFKAKASKAKQAQSRVKALERMEKVAPVLAEAEFNFDFKEPASLPNPMLAIDQASFGYVADDGAATTILRNVGRTVMAGQRIGILGANGQGKSTFIKTIARTMAPLAGSVTEGKGLAIGYFAQQELDVLVPDSSPLEHMVRLARSLGAAAPQGTREQDLRGWLGSFNFGGDMVLQPVGTMSGGEKARLVLAMIVWQRPNLLLLDEPTNHLDLVTREALAMALNGFEGTVLLVSHDRALLRTVCDEFWLVGRGGIAPFDGDLDDYQRYLVEESKRLRELARNAHGSGNASGATETIAARAIPETATTQNDGQQCAAQRKVAAAARQQRAEQARPLQRALESTEREMAELHAEQTNLHAQLATLRDPAKLAEASKRLKLVEQRLSDAEQRWMVAASSLEALR